MDATQLYWLAPIGSVMALVYSYYFYASMMKSDPGSEESQKIAGYVKEGAKSYLLAQYKIVGLFFIIAFAFFAFLAFVLDVQSPWTPIAFLTGGFFSALSGYLGMKTATSASNRTAAAANHSLNSALQIAFRSGAVMGFVVVGLGLLDISIWWKILNFVMNNKEMFKESIFAVNNYTEITTIMLTFGMGASSQALFARVGGGIFTKAADVGADLVGKTEAGIPEDDPRNPACIADNVGDNVGDVAGMGADLYESYCGSILATAALGAAAFNTPELQDLQLNSIVLPMAIAGIGIVFSIFGTYKINTKEEANQKELMESINYGVNFAAFFTAVTSVALVRSLLPGHFEIFGSIITGLMAGIIIGWATNYYTSEDYPPTANIAEQSTTGSATVIIEGIATGMLSTAIPVITVCIAILLSYGFANGFTNPAMGLYGIGIAAVGMLSTLGITLATDAYGPIADNAGGNAQMSGMSPEVRKRTDALDSLGNTTAATGKGFAIGSAALTALALIGAYLEEIRMALLRIAKFSGNPLSRFIYPTPDKAIPIEKASLYDFMNFYNVNLMNPVVLGGIFIGSMLVFVFCAMTMKAVGRAAHSMVEEVRRQFKEIPGLLKGEPNAKADYASCVAISTQGAQKEMVVPSLLAIIIPIVVGLLLGVAGVIGMLVGGLSTGFVLAIMMSNAGGAWDNAKKYVESGQFGGKGSENHKAAVVGDTVGDPFKDTAGPSLNILIKLMSMVAVVIAGLTVNYSPSIQYLIGLNPNELSNRKAYAIVSGAQDTEDLYSSKQSSSSLYEDPLLGTEDIILPTDEDMLRIKTLPADSKNEPKPAAQTPSIPTVSKQEKPAASSGFDSDFGGGFDSTSTEKQETKPSTSGGFDSGFGGGFDSFDTPAATEKKEEAKPATSGGFDSGFGGGFDSFDAPAATEKKEEAKPDTSGGFDSGFGGGFDSFDAPATTEKKEEAKPSTSGGFDSGFDSFDAPAATEKKEEAKPAEPAKAETPKADTSSGFDGGFDSFDAPATTEKKEEAKPAEPAKADTPKADTSSSFDGGFDSIGAPVATENKEEVKPAEPAKAEETKPEEVKPAEPAKAEETKPEEVKPAEPAKVEETKSEEVKPAEPAKTEETKLEETKNDSSPKAENVLNKVQEKVEEKIENKLNEAKEQVKEKVEEKKDAFEAGFGGF